MARDGAIVYDPVSPGREGRAAEGKRLRAGKKSTKTDLDPRDRPIKAEAGRASRARQEISRAAASRTFTASPLLEQSAVRTCGDDAAVECSALNLPRDIINLEASW